MDKKIFFEQLKAVHNISLTEQQYNGIVNTEGKHLLLACPGSGKTTVMVIKTAYLINVIGVLPYKILSITFSKAAAGDMKIRYTKLFGEHYMMPEFLTIHGFCYKLMKRYLVINNMKKENIDGKNSRNDSKNKVLGIIYERIFRRKAPEAFLVEIASAISYIKNFMLSWEDFDEYQFNIRFLKEIFIEYERYKEQYNYYDYDDMLLIGYRILASDNKLLIKLRKQFLYIQVDEAQDNSKIQNELIKLLTSEKSNLFMVADDDQTIYEFRGAYPDGVLKFKETYSGAIIHLMEQNFRSSKNIVDISNLFIQKNQNRYYKKLTTQNPSNNPIQIIKLKSTENQYEYAIKQITDKTNLSKVAFLFRNNYSAILIAHKLEEAGLNFFVKSYYQEFFNHFVVNDVKAFLLFSIRNETEYFEKIYYKNFASISKYHFERGKVNCRKRQSIIKDILHNDKLSASQRHKLIELKKQFKILAKKQVPQALLFIRKELGYERWVKSLDRSGDGSMEGINNIWRTLEAIAKGSLDFYDFINRIDRLQISLKAACIRPINNAIHLTTLHGSKGLEFDTVFMVDLDQGVIPSSEAVEGTQELEAERRLFYVGMTRAKYNLFLLSTSHDEGKRSLFVKEVEMILQHLQENI
ncbi:MAG: ATP-dependent helicase [Firmicutes bacterium HGW-Firmicutes-7]|nr:MAG: ATP-dependent helicase [Firmicutes bacterium HGW-Firmicutes-7]